MNRSIGLVGFTFIGVSGIIGSGWLFSPLLTSQLAGPASIISWLIGAAGMLLLALCFAEVSALMPVAGGIVRIPYITHGYLTANLLGWTAWIGYTLAAPIETVAMLQYMDVEFPWMYQDHMTSTNLTLAGKAVAISLLATFVLINAIGARFFIRINSTITWFKLAIPLLLAGGLILFHFEPKNFSSYEGFAPDGWHGILSAVSTGGIIFAFLGFRHAIDMAGEVKRPRRTIPLALILTILICTLVYVLMQIAFIGALGPHNLESGWQGLHFENDLGPIAGVVAGLGIAWMSTILYAGAIAGPLGASLVATGSNARVGQALAATRLLPDAFGQISQRGVPLNALLLNLALGIPVVLWVPFQEAVALNSAAISLSLAAGPLGVFSLRLQLPEAIRRFRLPLVHISAILAFSMVTMIIYWSGWDTVWRLGLALLSGGFFMIWRIIVARIPINSLDLLQASWLAPYTIGLGLLSYYGEFSDGLKLIPFGWDLLAGLILSITVFFYAVHCRLPQERITQFVQQNNLAKSSRQCNGSA
jgi:amino acid transporter